MDSSLQREYSCEEVTQRTWREAYLDLCYGAPSLLLAPLFLNLFLEDPINVADCNGKKVRLYCFQSAFHFHCCYTSANPNSTVFTLCRFCMLFFVLMSKQGLDAKRTIKPFLINIFLCMKRTAQTAKCELGLKQ